MSRMMPAAGRFSINAPKPFRVEYPFGMPGDGFRKFAKEGKATCVAYHRGVDPASLSTLPAGNALRYGPGSEEFEALVGSMRRDGFVGGNGQRIIVHVSKDHAWVAEGNHRLAAAIAAGVDLVEVEVRYLANADEERLLIPFDPSDPAIRVVAD